MATKPRKPIDLGLEQEYENLFLNDAQRAENRLPRIYDIPLTEIDEYPDHPFQVRLDEDMDQLVESVKERGVITPVTLRKKEDGRYETVSGHRRIKACEIAGKETVPAEIKELTRDEAIILMVDSNLQRTQILPSEKAMAYKMRLEAIKRQGTRTDLTSHPVGGKLVESATIVGESAGDSTTQVRRYIRLTELEPELLQMVDEGKIAMRPAVELSYLNDIEQQDLIAQIAEKDAMVRLGSFIWDLLHGDLGESYRSSMPVFDEIMSRYPNLHYIHDGREQVVLCHYPMMSWPHVTRTYMVFGHIHNNTNADYWNLILCNHLMLNAGVEINRYRPVTLDGLIRNNSYFKVRHTAE